MKVYIKDMNKVCFWLLTTGIEINIVLTLIAILLFLIYDRESFHYITAEHICTAAQKILIISGIAAFMGDIFVKMKSKKE
ncbi:MAG: hypothetical protein Q4B04_01930 [bacterium]|nr:hypothetical protein [bacterium]